MIVEKITEPKTHLECNDLTPSQKKVLFAVMAKYGALQYFAYDRFFKEGFHEWELKGINQIKRDFIDAHRAEIFPDGVDTHLLPTIDEMVNGKGVEEFEREIEKGGSGEETMPQGKAAEG